MPTGASRGSIGVLYMNERYEVIKKLYPYSIIYMKNKRGKYIAYGMDRRIVNAFGDKCINKIYINNLEIEKEETYENNRYLSCYIRVKFLEVVSYYKKIKKKKDGKLCKRKRLLLFH